MSITAERRNEYSQRFECRLRNNEAALLKAILKKEKITYTEFVRQAIASKQKV